MSVKVIRNDAISLTNGESRVLKILKKLYYELECEAYIYVQPIICGKRPDFVILDSKRGIAILEIKDWSKEYIRNITKTEVILEDKVEKNPLCQVDNYYQIIKGLLCVSEEMDVKDNIFGITIFTNLFQKDIEMKDFKEELNQLPMTYITADRLNSISINDLFKASSISLDSNILTRLRTILFPEIKILKEDNGDCTKLNVRALDENQEDFARKIPLGNYMVSGIPGSGKTVMLMARAVHLVKENPNWKVLILTYNKSLRKKLRSNLDKLSMDIKSNQYYRKININNIEILNFHQLTYRLTNGMIKPEEIHSDEWWNVKVVEKAFENAVPQYDAILIDEYQDFYDNWIKLCVKCCKPYKVLNSKQKETTVVNLFLAGDRLQSIYNPKEISWKKLGIDMRGRSKLLKTSYRATSDSINIALEFLQKDNGLKDEVQKFYKEEYENEINIENINKGTVEFLEGHYDVVTDKIKSLIEEENYKYNEILVLCRSRNICNNVIRSLDEKYRYVAAYVKDIDSMNSRIIFTTYQSAKGLEAKVVILVGVDMFKANENIDEDQIDKDRSNKDQLNRKLLYVGMTRASEKLYVHASSYSDSSFAKDIKELAQKYK